MPPVSAARQAAWARTAGFICHEPVSSGITEVSSLMAQEMTQRAAAALLETFPNTTMTVACTGSPGWMPPPRCAGPRRLSMPTRTSRSCGRHRRGGGHDGPGGAARVPPLLRHYPDLVSDRFRLARADQQLRAADPASGARLPLWPASGAGPAEPVQRRLPAPTFDLPPQPDPRAAHPWPLAEEGDERSCRGGRAAAVDEVWSCQRYDTEADVRRADTEADVRRAISEPLTPASGSPMVPRGQLARAGQAA